MDAVSSPHPSKQTFLKNIIADAMVTSTPQQTCGYFENESSPTRYHSSARDTYMACFGFVSQIENKLRADYTTTVVSNWGYWIPAQVVNFRFVAPAYQVRVLCFMFVCALTFFARRGCIHSKNVLCEHALAKAVGTNSSSRPLLVVPSPGWFLHPLRDVVATEHNIARCALVLPLANNLTPTSPHPSRSCFVATVDSYPSIDSCCAKRYLALDAAFHLHHNKSAPSFV